jgi:hypothetical protein
MIVYEAESIPGTSNLMFSFLAILSSFPVDYRKTPKNASKDARPLSRLRRIQPDINKVGVHDDMQAMDADHEEQRRHDRPLRYRPGIKAVVDMQARALAQK